MASADGQITRTKPPMPILDTLRRELRIPTGHVNGIAGWERDRDGALLLNTGSTIAADVPNITFLASQSIQR
ncbi:hypothetical protein HaLaN_17381 [Haematococcus lacustris]|uniref:Uncharacterized protein n=1 Tax=Haematococcus lacustris TaxID=44745 RepID=A0A699ZC61_HAELA|nr:hypothetical protein HaLaN_17381 [Haematococcus lacustris]